MALPNETLAAILHELPPPSLAAVACVSVRFNAVAERILYASVYITETLSETSPLPYRTLHWCEAMRRRPHLFDAVRRLHIRWQAVSPPAPPSPYLPSACDQLARILCHLALLESLDLFLGPANLVPGTDQHPPLHAVERAIAGCRFAQLRACALGADAAKGAQAYTRALGAFLGALPPALRALRLDLVGAPPGLPPLALPALAQFRGSADAAAALLPGRPVRALALVGDDADVTRENLPRMAATAGALRTLDLSAMPARPLLLRNVSTHLPAVESLRVRLALRHTLHYSFSGIVSAHPPPRRFSRCANCMLPAAHPRGPVKCAACVRAPRVPRPLADGRRRRGPRGLARGALALHGVAPRVPVAAPRRLPLADGLGPGRGRRVGARRRTGLRTESDCVRRLRAARSLRGIGQYSEARRASRTLSISRAEAHVRAYFTTPRGRTAIYTPPCSRPRAAPPTIMILIRLMYITRSADK